MKYNETEQASLYPIRVRNAVMVGAAGFEPTTPSMSRKCSTAELRALTRNVIYERQYFMSIPPAIP